MKPHTRWLIPIDLKRLVSSVLIDWTMSTYGGICITVDSPRASSDGKASANIPAEEPSTMTDAARVQDVDAGGPPEPELSAIPEAVTKEDAAGPEDEPMPSAPLEEEYVPPPPSVDEGHRP